VVSESSQAGAQEAIAGLTGDSKKAIEWYLKSANQGYALAQHKLGLMYMQGMGVPRDREKELEWYHKAAENGLSASHYAIGRVYYDMAEEWFEKGAKLGNFSSQYQLGKIYAIRKDYVKAYMWLSLASNNKYHRDPELLSEVGSKMTQEQIEQAKQSAKKWEPFQPKCCQHSGEMH